MAIVAQGNRQRVYLEPNKDHEAAALVDLVADPIEGSLGYYPRDLKAPTYGLTEFKDLFTDRQLLALTVVSDQVDAVRTRVAADGGSVEYANAVATYVGMTISRLLNKSSTISSWDSSPKMEAVRGLFARQAIPMSWDYAEANPFGGSSGDIGEDFEWAANALERVPRVGPPGVVTQADAATRPLGALVISTDPPYYDNIAYAELSDFLYVWLRRSLQAIYPDLLSTLLTPKSEELVANPYRHGGQIEAKSFFEKGFRAIFARARHAAAPDFPITVYYAFKQAESGSDGDASTGWETLLEGMLRSGWMISGTWPIRSEMSNRPMATGKNALASSIVLSLRPRPPGAAVIDRRGFIGALEAELPDALRKLQQGMIAPVDLPQAAIGPGMTVFSRFDSVLEADGGQMSVRSALARINEVLDEVLNEQEGDFDASSRFAIAWYRQHGYGVGKFGDADNLARARNTSVDVMDRDEILISRAGNVQLIRPADLPWAYDVQHDSHTSNWEALHHLIKVLERDGIAPAGDFFQAALARPDGAVDADLVKELAHLLFRIAESNGWTKDALSFNNLVTSWPEILDVARSQPTPAEKQFALDFDGDE